LVVGGRLQGAGYSDTAELVDLENPANSCILSARLPIATQEAILTYSEITREAYFCGGINPVIGGTRNCFSISSSSPTWTRSDSLVFQHQFAAGSMLTDGSWLITGGAGTFPVLDMDLNTFDGSGFKGRIWKKFPVYV